jgi:hypothetical protein
MILLAVMAATLLAGCSPATPTPAPDAALTENYDRALSPRNQLLVGTVLLEETDHRVTPEQAKTITPLWQALRTLVRSQTTAEEEIDALVAQLQTYYTKEQLDAIAALELTTEDMQALFDQLGLRAGTGTGLQGGGGGRNLSDAERAAREATRTASGQTMGSGQTGLTGNSALMDYVVKMLEARAQ